MICMDYIIYQALYLIEGYLQILQVLTWYFMGWYITRGREDAFLYDLAWHARK